MAITTTGSGTAVNCAGYSQAMVTVTASTSGGCTVLAVVEQSADGSTGWANVGTIGTIPASSTKYVLTASVNLKKTLHYLRVTYTITGSVTAGVNAVVNLTNPVQFPVVQTNGTVYL